MRKIVVEATPGITAPVRWLPASMQRARRSEELASLVAFLASDEASYITGQIISVNGGTI